MYVQTDFGECKEQALYNEVELCLLLYWAIIIEAEQDTETLGQQE